MYLDLEHHDEPHHDDHHDDYHDDEDYHDDHHDDRYRVDGHHHVPSWLPIFCPCHGWFFLKCLDSRSEFRVVEPRT